MGPADRSPTILVLLVASLAAGLPCPSTALAASAEQEEAVDDSAAASASQAGQVDAPAPAETSDGGGDLGADRGNRTGAGSASADREHEHRFGFGLALGYGHGVAPRARQVGRDVADVRFLAINPHVRMRLARPGAGDRWYHGTLEGMLEGSVLVNFEPHTGHAGGVLVGLRYQILPGRRLRPYAEAGLGVGGMAFGLEGQADGLAFFIDAGAGLRWRLNDALSLTAAVRWHHISNAQTRQPNNGVDDVLFLLGLEIW